MTHYTNYCTEFCKLILRPVAGAKSWPRILVCETHGYPNETQRKLTISASADREKPNDYITEVASSADVYEVGGNLISQY
jgi:hypothetical protein